MKIALIAILGGLLLIGLMVGGKAASVNNELVSQKEAITGSWSQVDVALQRRADLIPNLVESVKGFAAQEKGIMESVANARAALLSARTPAEKIQANQGLDSAIGRLLMVVENYPQLKSSENFLRLQDELAGTENRIKVERDLFNTAVKGYNIKVRRFPASIVAGMSGFTVKESFQAQAGAENAPKVSFG